MSKQSEAKEKQDYCAKPILKTCANCRYLSHNFFHYSSNGIRVEGENPYLGRPTYSEKLRCSVGGFAVKKTATCGIFEIRG